VPGHLIVTAKTLGEERRRERGNKRIIEKK
jgi:hypothetical protein